VCIFVVYGERETVWLRKAQGMQMTRSTQYYKPHTNQKNVLYIHRHCHKPSKVLKLFKQLKTLKAFTSLKQQTARPVDAMDDSQKHIHC